MAAPVQSRPVKQQAPSGTISDTFASSTPAGNLVIAVIAQQNAGAPIRAITSVADSVDSANLSYIIGIQDGAPNARIDIYARVATSSGTRTVTCTFTGGSAEASLCIIELDSTYVVSDAVNAATGTSTTATPGSTTPSATAFYLNAVNPSNLASGGITQDAAYTLIQEAESSGTSAPLNVSYKEGSGASNPSTTFASSTWANALATFIGNAPSITAQPTPQTCYEGQTATFTISATASAGSLSYQWKDDGSNVGTDSNSYTTGAAVYANDNGAQITCVVTDDNGSTTSKAATWNVLIASKPFYLRA